MELRRELVPLLRCQAEIMSNALGDVSHAGLALGGAAQDGEHEGLVAEIIQAQSFASGLRPQPRWTLH